MTVDILSIQGEKTGRTIDLPEEIFGVEPNEHVLYLSVKQYLANQRQGTHKAKERSEVSGSTRKLHRQKGTGGSRKGDINNPLYPGGGRVFGPRPRDYRQKLNKKVKILARKCALSTKVTAGSLVILEDFSFPAPKTSAFREIVTALQLNTKKALFVTADYEKEVLLSSRNLEKVEVMRAVDLNAYQILRANTVILSEGSIEKIREILV